MRATKKTIACEEFVIGHDTRIVGGTHASLLAGSVSWPTARARQQTPLRELSSRTPRWPPQDIPCATAHRERPLEQARRRGQEHRRTGSAAQGQKKGTTASSTHSCTTEDCKARWRFYNAHNHTKLTDVLLGNVHMCGQPALKE